MKKRQKAELRKLGVKKLVHKFDFKDNLSSGDEEDDDDDDDENDSFGFNNDEAKEKKVVRKEEISYTINPYESEAEEAEEDDDEEEGSGGKGKRRSAYVPPPVIIPDYVELNMFEEKSNCSECWGCLYRFGPSRIRSKNSTADKIYDTFVKNMKDLPLEALCTLIEAVFEKLIYEPSVTAVQISKKGVAVEPWPYDIIMSHLKHHMQDPRLKLKAMFRDNEIIEAKIKNTLMEMKQQADGSTKPEPSFKNIKSFIQFQNHQLNVFKHVQLFENAELSKARN